MIIWIICCYCSSQIAILMKHNNQETEQTLINQYKLSFSLKCVIQNTCINY